MLNRREFLAVTGASAVGTALATLPRFSSVAALPLAKPDFTLRIAPVSLEIAPGTVIKTVGYNGKAPGPVLRMREGKRTTFDIYNHTDVMAAENLDRGGFTGQFGFFYVEPKNEPGKYDQEIFLAAHHWEPSLAHMGPQNNGWEIAYNSCSFNDKALGHGDPIRVKRGQRVLFRFLNSSATDDIQLALPGHKFKVLALDGNPVPTQATVDVLTIAIAERVDALVEMNQPGIWILGDVKDEERKKERGEEMKKEGKRGEQ